MKNCVKHFKVTVQFWEITSLNHKIKNLQKIKEANINKYDIPMFQIHCYKDF